MDEIKEIVEFLLQFRNTPISWFHVILAMFLSLLIFTILEIWEVKIQARRDFNFALFLCKFFISAVVIFLIVWLFGEATFIPALIFGIISSFYIQEKYFKFLTEEESDDEVRHNSELSRLKKEFRNNPHYSILEVLLYYGYISPLQKEYVETQNIFETPEEMAEKLLSLSALTSNQLKEAKAIMNIIRREGKVLTKQDALLLISKIEERREQNEEH